MKKEDKIIEKLKELVAHYEAKPISTRMSPTKAELEWMDKKYDLIDELAKIEELKSELSALEAGEEETDGCHNCKFYPCQKDEKLCCLSAEECGDYLKKEHEQEIGREEAKDESCSNCVFNIKRHCQNRLLPSYITYLSDRCNGYQSNYEK